MTEPPADFGAALDAAYARCDAYRDAYFAMYVLVHTPGLTDVERSSRAATIDGRLETAREAARRSPEPVEP
jgi:hypothetical protein